MTQVQRKLETKVREQKDIANIAKASGDDVLRREAQAKINKYTGIYENVSKAAGLPTKKERMAVSGFRPVKAKTVNQARANEYLHIIPPMKGDSIKPQSIYKELQKSNIGKETWNYIKNKHPMIEINYTDEAPIDLRGYQQGNNIYIYAKNTKTVKITAKTLIHEITHIKLNIGGDQWSEAVCIAQEKKHEKEILTFRDKRDIIRETKELYPDMKWRKKNV